MGLLALEVGVEILHPLFVFGDAGAFDFAEIHFAFIELGLEDGDVLLGELEFEARDFFGSVAFAKMARFLADGGADLLFFIGKIGFGDAEIHFCERDVGFRLGAEDRDLNVDAGVEIIAFEFLEKFGVVVEFGEQAVGGNQFERGIVAALFAGEAELFRADVGHVGLNRGVILHGHRDEVGAFLLGFAGKIFGSDLDRRFLLQAALVAEKDFEFVLAALELEDALCDQGFRELGASDFDGELEIFFFALLRDFENFVGAALFFLEEIERVADHDEFEIRGGSPRDHGGAARVFKEDALGLGLFLKFFGLAAEWFVDDLLRVTEAEELQGRGRPEFRECRRCILRRSLRRRWAEIEIW